MLSQWRDDKAQDDDDGDDVDRVKGRRVDRRMKVRQYSSSFDVLWLLSGLETDGSTLLGQPKRRESEYNHNRN